ncbi:FxsA family protein [Neisseria sp. ZJ106]|uniref:FxsA family protein n=1 Tax=Neisseria lisongii TaxID=2912188 RepID=A0ABY7RHS1_9NEIS|nr:FxsA family protein [Neisseria lisongii]MCF7520844.1 FxsA family protein [Neisseria lisongii]WCL70778.1 FxsA family protein [Neisseria lisongii]
MQVFGIGFLVLLFFEIMSIVWVADWLGGGLTLLLMAASFAAGVMMLRHTGLSGILLAGATLRSGQNISLYQMLWPIRYALAAVLLMSPGFISTVIALLLLLPIKGKPVAAMQQTPFQTQRTTRSGTRDDDIIEGEYTVTRPNGKPQDYIEHQSDEHSR